MPYSEHGEGRLFYTWSPAKVSGVGPGLTLLFIHGLGSSSSFYATVTPSLTNAGFSCLAIDTYGSGLSKFTGLRQDTKSIADDARHILSSLDINSEATVVVGHSMGCIVACELASAYHFAGMVLIGAIDPSPKYREVFEKRIATVKSSGMESMANLIPVAATGSKSTPLHHAFIRALLLSQTSDGYASLCDAIVTARKPDYAEIKCPVLILAGEEDKTASIEDARQIMVGLGSDPAAVRLDILPGVGHWHCIEAPDLVAQLLGGFAEEIRSRDT